LIKTHLEFHLPSADSLSKNIPCLILYYSWISKSLFIFPASFSFLCSLNAKNFERLQCWYFLHLCYYFPTQTSLGRLHESFRWKKRGSGPRVNNPSF